MKEEKNLTKTEYVQYLTQVDNNNKNKNKRIIFIYLFLFFSILRKFEEEKTFKTRKQ